MPKVLIALSGGVDSAVSAALLKKAGFAVRGIFMKCWPENRETGCSSPGDERAARIVASFLKIPFESWDFIKEYQEKVLNYLVAGYQKGLTPNPDIVCNQQIKFGLFFDRAIREGADFVATGHYAHKREIKNQKSKIKNYELLKAKDKRKDQSYFLATINPMILDKVLFPVGDYTKTQVRQMAKGLGLPNAERHSSQGLCFVGKVDFARFLRQYLKPKPGQIVDLKGKILGKHSGIFYYTIGQRQGLKLSGGPYYVVRKDAKKNLLVVSQNEKDLLQKEFLVEKANWFSKPEKFPLSARVKIRFHQPDLPAEISQRGDSPHFVVRLKKPAKAVAPGQFAVFYSGEELLGAGVIK